MAVYIMCVLKLLVKGRGQQLKEKGLKWSVQDPWRPIDDQPKQRKYPRARMSR